MHAWRIGAEIGRTAWLRARALEAYLCRRTLWIRVELLDPLVHAGGQPSALVQPVHTEQLGDVVVQEESLLCHRLVRVIIKRSALPELARSMLVCELLPVQPVCDTDLAFFDRLREEDVEVQRGARVAEQ